MIALKTSCSRLMVLHHSSASPLCMRTAHFNFCSSVYSVFECLEHLLYLLKPLLNNFKVKETIELRGTQVLKPLANVFLVMRHILYWYLHRRCLRSRSIGFVSILCLIVFLFISLIACLISLIFKSPEREADVLAFAVAFFFLSAIDCWKISQRLGLSCSHHNLVIYDTQGSYVS